MKLVSTLILFCALLLGGCAPSTAIRISNGNEGVLAIRSAIVNELAALQASRRVVVERLADADGKAQSFSLYPQRMAFSKSPIYLGALPAGRYRFLSFEMNGECREFRCDPSLMTLAENFSRFDIRPGTLTDLGVMVTDYLDDRVLMAHDSAKQHPETSAIVRALAPDLEKVLINPIISWDPDLVLDGDALRSLTSKTDTTILLPDRQVAPNQTFVFGNRVGALEFLHADGSISHSDTRAAAAIDSILFASNGAWFAGGEFGHVHRSTDNGNTWKDIRAGLPVGTVSSLNEWNGNVYATVIEATSVSLYQFSEGQKWQLLLKQQSAPITILGDAYFPSYRSQVYGNRIFLLAPPNRILVFDLQTKKLTRYETPKQHNGLMVAKDGSLRINGADVSFDFGATWQRPYSFPHFMLIPTFFDAKHGVAVIRKWIKAPARLAYTEDGGKTWNDSRELALHSSSIMKSDDGKAAYVEDNGRILISKDQGKTWQRLAPDR
jgi:photosystem II stability/assembly factor-like uncharacterized protein